MRSYLLLGFGGVVGVVLRYQIGVWFSGWTSPFSFPWATFTVNIVGSFLLGFLMKYLLGMGSTGDVRLMLTTGFCGGFTTLSTFSYEFVTYLGEGQLALGFLYAGLTMVCAPLACFAGFGVAALAL